MPPNYEKQILDKLAAQSQENNKILRGLRSHARLSAFFGFIKWVIIIAPIVLAYIYFEPYIDSFKNNSKGIIEDIRSIQGIRGKIQEFIVAPSNGTASTTEEVR